MDASRQRAREILDAAFDDSFAPLDSVPNPVPQPQDAPTALSTVAPTTSGVGVEQALEGSNPGDDESWKEEYETHQRGWRAQSAEQREKAEKERLRWEAIRAQEKVEADRRKAAGGLSIRDSWEKLGASGTSTAPSSHDRPRAEPSTQEGAPDDMQKWENVPSMAASFPSIPDTLPAPAEPPQKTPVSVTLSIFDSSLSTRTRILAFASSLAMNLVLPFINGVMLGFGEIFARRVVTEWLGWKIPTINVGLRTGRGR